MTKGFKLLVGYDGSECADAALDDLSRAGLPDKVEAHILSIAEVWLPPPPPAAFEIIEQAREVKVPSDLRHVYTKNCKAAKASLASAERARERVKAVFPKWEVFADSACGSPAWELIFRADNWKPDLIVVGSHGRTALGRFVLGSVSQRVLTESRCTVRISRGRVDEPNRPVRLIVGVDGSPGSEAAVRAVASRNWPANSEVMLVAVDDLLVPEYIGKVIPPLMNIIEEDKQEELSWAKGIVERSAKLLAHTQLRLTPVLRQGDPKHELPHAAVEWGADCIFLGSEGFSNRLERFVLGSVSAAVAARAHCSVEVVRVGDRGNNKN